MAKPSASSRARKIKLLLFDVDGVLTDGKLFFLPAPAGLPQKVPKTGHTSPGRIEFKGFHAH
ncbi:MAG: phosphatase, partial [Candidatus Sulfotelmatobacter sp.]